MALGFQVTFDCADPTALATFWAAALGYILQPPPSVYASWDDFADKVGIPEDQRGDISAVVDPDGNGPRLLFLKVPEGKTAKNRVHLDINAGADHQDDPGMAQIAIDAHVTRLASIGATEIRRHDEATGRWVVMTDPEGNEFCIQ